MIAEPPLQPAEIDTAVILAGFGTLALLSSVAAVVAGVRTRDLLPVAAILGALVCSLNEPIYDLLGKIVYASDAAVAYTNFGRDIPWFLVIGYIPWVGFLPYVISRLMAGGTSRSTLHWIAFGSFVSVVIVETIGTSLGVWTYYGDPPPKYIGVAPQQAACPIVIGFLLYAGGSMVRSQAARGAVGLIAPTVGLPLVYAATSWPLYVGLYADIPQALEWLAAAASLGMAALATVFTTSLAARLRDAGTGTAA